MNIVQFFGFTWLTGQCSIATQSSIHKKGSLLDFFLIDPKSHDGLPRWLSGKESPYQCRRHGFDSRVGTILWRRKWQPTPEFLLGKFMNRGVWWATVRGVEKSPIQLSNQTKTAKPIISLSSFWKYYKPFFTENWFLKSLLAFCLLADDAVSRIFAVFSLT